MSSISTNENIYYKQKIKQLKRNNNSSDDRETESSLLQNKIYQLNPALPLGFGVGGLPRGAARGISCTS